MNVQRWDVYPYYDGLSTSKSHGGDWVKHSDVTALEAEVARLRGLLQTIECPCCGDVAAYAKFFEDGQETICGCGGLVMCDGESAHVSVDVCERPECGPDGTAIAPAQKDVPRG